MSSSQPQALLQVTVSNHAGVLAHICNLCSRRAYQVEAVLLAPAAGATRRHIWLMLNEGARLEQIERQLRKLEDVHEVQRHEPAHALFAGVP